jgi:hypothetical protein
MIVLDVLIEVTPEATGCDLGEHPDDGRECAAANVSAHPTQGRWGTIQLGAAIGLVHRSNRIGIGIGSLLPSENVGELSPLALPSLRYSNEAAAHSRGKRAAVFPPKAPSGVIEAMLSLANFLHAEKTILGPRRVEGLRAATTPEATHKRPGDQIGAMQARELRSAQGEIVSLSEVQQILPGFPSLKRLVTAHNYSLRDSMHDPFGVRPTLHLGSANCRLYADENRRRPDMEHQPLNQPIPALALALGVATLSHKANANAARALGLPISLVGLLVSGLLAVGAMRAA